MVNQPAGTDGFIFARDNKDEAARIFAWACGEDAPTVKDIELQVSYFLDPAKGRQMEFDRRRKECKTAADYDALIEWSKTFGEAALPNGQSVLAAALEAKAKAFPAPDALAKCNVCGSDVFASALKQGKCSRCATGEPKATSASDALAKCKWWKDATEAQREVIRKDFALFMDGADPSEATVYVEGMDELANAADFIAEVCDEEEEEGDEEKEKGKNPTDQRGTVTGNLLQSAAQATPQNLAESLADQNGAGTDPRATFERYLQIVAAAEWADNKTRVAAAAALQVIGADPKLSPLVIAGKLSMRVSEEEVAAATIRD